MHRHPPKALAAGLSLLALVSVLNGCGSSDASTAAGGGRSIRFESSAVRADGVIDPSTRCGSGSLWLPLKWGAVPPGTKELAVYIGRFKYEKVHGNLKLVVPFADLVYHIKPSRRGNAANTIPEEAAWSFFGDLSCPPVRKGQSILQQVFAFDHPRYRRELTQAKATQLTEEALGAKQSTSTPPAPLGDDLIGVGRFVATYATYAP